MEIFVTILYIVVEKIVIEKNEQLISKNLFQYFKNSCPPTLAPYVDYLLFFSTWAASFINLFVLVSSLIYEESSGWTSNEIMAPQVVSLCYDGKLFLCYFFLSNKSRLMSLQEHVQDSSFSL